MILVIEKEMFDPGKPRDRVRLQSEIKRAREDQAGFRTTTVEMLREYAGSLYSKSEGFADHEVMEETLVNLLFQTADIMVQSLVAQNPRCSVETEFEDLIPFAYIFERAVNNLSVEIDLRQTLYLAILDAYFSQGMIKVYNAEGGDVFRHLDINVDPGRPFAERISRDDYVYQPAKSWNRVGWIEHTYQLTKEGLKDARFDQKLVKKLTPQTWNKNASETRASDLTTHNDDGQDGYRDLYTIKEVYMPFDKHQIITFGVGEEKPIGVQNFEYQGYSPYHRLTFSDMVDNVEAISPASQLYPLHDLINSIARKSARQARRSKSVPFFEADSEDDSRRIKRAADGEWTRIQRKDGVGVLTLEGVNSANENFRQMLMGEYNQLAGNPQAKAGLSQGADTATQEKIIQASIGEVDAKRQGRVASWTEGIMSHLGLQLWKNKFKSIPASSSFEGQQFDVSWDAEYREGQFVRYNFKVEPYSMVYKSPSQRANDIDQVVMQVVMPSMPLIQQAGGMFDIQEYLLGMAELKDEPRLNRLVKWSAPPAIERPGIEDGGAADDKPTQMPTTVRHNVRHNEGGGNSGPPQMPETSQQSPQSQMAGVV